MPTVFSPSFPKFWIPILRNRRILYILHYYTNKLLVMIMSYSEQELDQVLVKLSALISTKITSSSTPNPTDFDFLAQLRVYIDRISKNNPKEQNAQISIKTQLRSFLRRGKPWEKMETPIPDVSVIKVPIKKQKIAALHLVINHMKREFDVKNSQAFQKLKGVFDDARVNSLIEEIEQVNKMRIRLSS